MMQMWYYMKKGVQGAPCSLHKLKEMLRTGQIGRWDKVWTDGMQNFQPVERIAELVEFLQELENAPVLPPALPHRSNRAYEDDYYSGPRYEYEYDVPEPPPVGQVVLGAAPREPAHPQQVLRSPPSQQDAPPLQSSESPPLLPDRQLPNARDVGRETSTVLLFVAAVQFFLGAGILGAGPELLGGEPISNFARFLLLINVFGVSVVCLVLGILALFRPMTPALFGSVLFLISIGTDFVATPGLAGSVLWFKFLLVPALAVAVIRCLNVDDPLDDEKSENPLEDKASEQQTQTDGESTRQPQSSSPA